MKFDLDKYIERTKRKTKTGELPALSTMSPVLPDGGTGIATFNSNNNVVMNNISEDVDIDELNRVKSLIESNSKKFMIEKGFSENDLDQVLSISYSEDENITTINIHADLTISSLRELADTLYDIVSEYDEDAYFDISANNTISVDLTMKERELTEKLHKLDQIGFNVYCENYEFEALYESMKSKLNTEDKTKLQKFIQTTDDPEEVNTFMKGLLLEDAENEFEYDDMYDDYEIDESEYTDLISELDNAYNTFHDLLNQLVNDANKNGNDTLRSSSDLALGALDDVAAYVDDIKNELGV